MAKKIEAEIKRVLFCEDDQDIAALLRLLLEQLGRAAGIAYVSRFDDAVKPGSAAEAVLDKAKRDGHNRVVLAQKSLVGTNER